VIDYADRAWRAKQYFETNRPMLAPLGTLRPISVIDNAWRKAYVLTPGGNPPACSKDGSLRRGSFIPGNEE